MENHSALVGDKFRVMRNCIQQGRCQLIGKVPLAVTAHLWMSIQQELQPSRTRLHRPANKENLLAAELRNLTMHPVEMQLLAARCCCPIEHEFFQSGETWTIFS